MKISWSTLSAIPRFSIIHVREFLQPFSPCPTRGSSQDTILNVWQERESEEVELKTVKVEDMNMLSLDIENSDARKHARQDDLLALHQECEGRLWPSMIGLGRTGCPVPVPTENSYSLRCNGLRDLCLAFNRPCCYHWAYDSDLSLETGPLRSGEYLLYAQSTRS